MVTALTNRLRRVTNGRAWIPEIDGLRFLAIAGVVLFHIGGELSARSGHIIPLEHRYWLVGLALGNADRGVRLFFVLSGLVLALPFARQYLADGKRVVLSSYYMRRLTRLEPPYIVSVLLFVVVYMVYAHGISAEYVRHSLATFFYVHNLVYAAVSPINMVTWSLEVEVQFYLAAPLAMQLFRIRDKRLRRAIFFALILACGLVQVSLPYSARMILSIGKYVQYFLAGLLAADYFVLDMPMWRESAWWDVAAAASAATMMLMGHDLLTAHVVLPLLCGVLCLAAMRGRVTRRCLATPWVAVTGGMCYSIYLMHEIAVAALFKITRHAIVPGFDYMGNMVVQCALMIPMIMGISIAFYLAVERPCMDPQWPAKLAAKLRRQPSEQEMPTRS